MSTFIKTFHHLPLGITWLGERGLAYQMMAFDMDLFLDERGEKTVLRLEIPQTNDPEGLGEEDDALTDLQRFIEQQTDTLPIVYCSDFGGEYKDQAGNKVYQLDLAIEGEGEAAYTAAIRKLGSLVSAFIEHQKKSKAMERYAEYNPKSHEMDDPLGGALLPCEEKLVQDDLKAGAPFSLEDLREMAHAQARAEFTNDCLTSRITRDPERGFSL